LYDNQYITEQKGLTFIENQNQVIIDDSWNPVSDGNDSAITSLFPDSLLNLVIGGRVNRSGRLIQYHDPSLLQKHPSKASQLSLPDAPIFSVLSN